MLKVVSLYTGAGGLDLGMEAAGLTTTVAVEFDHHSCETLRANSGPSRSWEVVEGDIHDVSSDQIANSGGIEEGEPALLIGGPPCQPFSKSGYWAQGDTKRLDDPRADTLAAYLRVLRDLQPRAFLLENVYGLTYKGKDEGLRLLIETVDQINRDVGTSYSLEWKILNTADYGVPQIRERVFLVGAKDGRRFQFPEPTHQDPNPKSRRRKARSNGSSLQTAMFADGQKESKPLQPWSTAWDAIGDLEGIEHANLSVGGRWGDLLPSIPEGENYLHHTDRKDGLPIFGWRRRYWSFLLKLAKRLPSWTIQAQPGSAVGPFHWQNRRLSIEEMLRIQTFPDGYQVSGGRTEVQRQLGNAVPSLMAEVLGRAIREQLLDEPASESTPVLLPKHRTPVPEPEPVADVPEKYLPLVGDHAPHPGTGKGHLVNGLSG
jgi:DNA (cytosine-5)-methyltransferase 1